MARYDRIARIDPPDRDDAFTGWLAVRDLDGRERDVQLGRRARLRFLTVRLIHRLGDPAVSIDDDSVQLQANALREELGQLPNRDPERQRIADLIDGVIDAEPAAVVHAAYALADGARSQRHPFAAEEYLLVGTRLAEEAGLDSLHAKGRTNLATLRAARRDGAVT